MQKIGFSNWNIIAKFIYYKAESSWYEVY